MITFFTFIGIAAAFLAGLSLVASGAVMLVVTYSFSGKMEWAGLFLLVLGVTILALLCFYAPININIAIGQLP